MPSANLMAKPWKVALLPWTKRVRAKLGLQAVAEVVTVGAVAVAGATAAAAAAAAGAVTAAAIEDRADTDRHFVSKAPVLTRAGAFC
jgi:hypothetical protein